MKEIKIFGKEIIPEGALEQMKDAMNNDFVVKGALMPDSHEGYSLPIGGVVATKDVIVPAWVGYDIGCGMCAINTTLKKEDIEGKEKEIFDKIYETIPVSHGQYNKEDQVVNFNVTDKTRTLINIFSKFEGLKQVGTLGGGNHFMEISYDENNEVWIVIHSGSRGIGHKTACHYMDLAKELNFNDIELIKSIEKEFDENPNYEGVRTHNPEKYGEIKGIYVDKKIKELSKGNHEGHYGLNVNSKEGQDYIQDMNFCLEFALQNRLLMIKKILDILEIITGKGVNRNFTLKDEGGCLINRNHNHAVFKDGLWIHRKGATHSEKGMYGVIPGNMRDGSFIVKGKGNPDSLYSSSHGAGRVLGRKEAHRKINFDDFKNTMIGITAKVDESTKDESPFAYKDIFEVMKYQDENVEIVSYLKPLINIKG